MHDYQTSAELLISIVTIIIIESVDSVSRDGPDTPIYVIHNKSPKSSVQLQFQDV